MQFAYLRWGFLQIWKNIYGEKTTHIRFCGHWKADALQGAQQQCWAGCGQQRLWVGSRSCWTAGFDPWHLSQGCLCLAQPGQCQAEDPVHQDRAYSTLGTFSPTATAHPPLKFHSYALFPSCAMGYLGSYPKVRNKKIGFYGISKPINL